MSKGNEGNPGCILTNVDRLVVSKTVFLLRLWCAKCCVSANGESASPKPIVLYKKKIDAGILEGKKKKKTNRNSGEKKNQEDGSSIEFCLFLFCYQQEK